MATQNHNTHVYSLSSAHAAALRVPPIYYPGDIVPGTVINKVMGCNNAPDTPICSLDALLEKILWEQHK